MLHTRSASQPEPNRPYPPISPQTFATPEQAGSAPPRADIPAPPRTTAAQPDTPYDYGSPARRVREASVYDGARPARATPRLWLRIPLANPRVTPVLLGVLITIFGLMVLAGGSLSPADRQGLLQDWGAKVNSLIADGEWWRLITATFLHANFVHIALKGYALYVIGIDLEALVGRARFIAIYFVSGLAGSIASFIFSPAMGVGASGAIFGLIGALAIYYGLHRRLFGKIGQIQFWNIIAVIALNIAFGFSGILPVDNSAHLGGLVAGLAMGYVLCPRYIAGKWVMHHVRDVVNANTGPLPWIAAGLLALNLVLVFLVSVILYRAGVVLYIY